MPARRGSVGNDPLLLTSGVRAGRGAGSRTGAVAGFAPGTAAQTSPAAASLGIGALVGCVLRASAGGIRGPLALVGPGACLALHACSGDGMTGANAFLQGLGLRASGMWFWLVAGSAVCAAVLAAPAGWMQAVMR